MNFLEDGSTSTLYVHGLQHHFELPRLPVLVLHFASIPVNISLSDERGESSLRLAKSFAKLTSTRNEEAIADIERHELYKMFNSSTEVPFQASLMFSILCLLYAWAPCRNQNSHLSAIRLICHKGCTFFYNITSPRVPPAFCLLKDKTLAPLWACLWRIRSAPQLFGHLLWGKLSWSLAYVVLPALWTLSLRWLINGLHWM